MPESAFTKILFVCTGNTCRSPMAAALFRDLCARKGGGCPTVESAGLSAYFPAPASQNAAAVMEEVGLSLSEHLSRPLSPELLDGGTLFVPMTAAHRAALRGSGIPEENLASLGEIDDPFGGGLPVYRRTRDLLAERLEALYDTLFARDATDGAEYGETSPAAQPEPEGGDGAKNPPAPKPEPEGGDGAKKPPAPKPEPEGGDGAKNSPAPKPEPEGGDGAKNSPAPEPEGGAQ